jgi:predicted metalloprotease with PDZ domain
MNQESLESKLVFQDELLDQVFTAPDLARHSLSSPLRFHYTVAMPEPASHLFEVTLHIAATTALPASLLLKMPVWTPGSYLVREYARHVQNFVAIAPTGVPLSWQKQGKNSWQVETGGVPAITLQYRVYANELSVRTNHLDSSHGYFNGAALFFYSPGYETCPIHVTIAPPYPSWHVTTPLAAVPHTTNTFLAPNFDTLVDSPFEIGTHAVYTFEVANKPHQFAVWGNGNLVPASLIADVQRIIQVAAELFEGLPYDRYLFLLHLTGQGFGGLEHKTSCSLIYQRFGFQNREKYQRFLQLVAHEFFHLWNVKRIRPKALEQVDYNQENYTPSLWFSEGTTSYYDLLIPLRAGLYDAHTYLSELSREVSRYLTTPGRLVQPLSESSFDAWVKLYRQDANSPNSQVSYYLKGEMVSLLLDLLIRAKHQNRRSLDDVMRQMWQHFGKSETGFTPQQLQDTISEIAGTDLSEFFQRYLHTVEELPFDDYLYPFGLCLQAEGDGTPYLGLVAKSERGQDWIKFVETGSPAGQAGINGGDELLALNGIRVSADHLSDRLRDFQPGDTVQLAVFHHDELLICPVTLAKPRPTRYQIALIEQLSPEQIELLQGWLGATANGF